MIDSETPQASFNVDTLQGGAGSKFTRNGTPEAIDPTKMNVYRIRFGWLGSTPIYFSVLSPDGEWVLFHTMNTPNSQVVPSIQDPNLPISVIVSKTGSDSTDLVVKSSSWVAGTNYQESSGESIERVFTQENPINVAPPLYYHADMICLLEDIKKELTAIRFNLGIINGIENLETDEVEDRED